MKKILFAFIILVLIGGQSNSYAAALPIEYNGVAYWGESHTQYTFPSDPRIGIPLPTEFSEGVVEDVLGQYRYLGTWLSPSFHVADECLGYYSSGSCWRYTYHWAVTRSIDCYAPLLPNHDYTQCVAPPAEQYFVSTNDLDKPLPFDPQSCSNEESNNSSPVTTVGNPIDTKDGNKSRTETDYTQSGISPLEFTRYYNSNKSRKIDVGVNWRHTYGTTLTENIRSQSIIFNPNDVSQSSQYGSAQEACELGWSQIKSQFAEPEIAQANAIFEIASGTCNISSGGSIGVRQANTFLVNPPQDTIVIERANGNTITFTLVNSVWTAPSDTDVSLIQTETGYTLTTAQDTVEQYNLKGQLISSVDRKGLQQTLAYNATTNLLETVTDSFGNALTFNYNGTNVSSVILPDSTTLTYSYDANNNFSSVKREDTTVKTYVYEDARFPNALTGIIDENNQRYMTFSYDLLGRAITSELGDGVNLSAEKVTVNYINDTTSTVTDALGQLRTYRFTTINGEKRLTDIEGAPCSSCGGKATHTTYDAKGYVASSTDFNGNVTTFINNARGLATTRTEATGTANERVTTTVWHATYPLPLKITQAGHVTDLTYDANGNVLTRTQTDTTNNKTRTWTYTYNAYGQVLSVDGARTDVNDITTYAYDIKGNLTRVTNALGHVTNITAYDARNNPLTLVDANGLTTQLTYDIRGRVVSRTLTANGTTLTTTISYDNVGNLKSIQLSDGQILYYNYDAAHRLVGLSDQEGNRIDYTLNALGKRLKEDTFDPVNTLVRTRSQVFNILNQLIQSVGAQNQTTSFGYDANGNQLTVTDAANATTTSAFDALNRVISVTDPLNGVSSYDYDTQGHLASVKDANGVSTTYTYDGLGHRMSQSSPDTGVTSYTYDSAGNMLSSTDASSQTTAYQYDALNRVTLITYDDNTVVSYTYDQGINQRGRLNRLNTTNASATSSSLSYTYDSLGRIISKVQTVNSKALTTSYTYDLQGRINTKTTPAGSVVQYNYTNGLLSGLRLNGAPLLYNMTYAPFGSITGWTWGSGSIHSRGYDLDGRLITQTTGNVNRTLGYDSRDNITSLQQTTDAYVNINQLLGYDALNRLTAANDSRYAQTFNYDANGNRTSNTDILPLSTTADTYNYDANNKNRLISITGSAGKTYQYNLNGNIIHDGLHSYGYNARNRLATVDTTAATYQYNGLGQRVQKNTASGTTLYLYNEQGQLVAEANQNGIVEKEYFYVDSQPVAVTHISVDPVTNISSSSLYYIHTDHLGTPRVVTNPITGMVWTWYSDPFGKTSVNDDVDGDGIKFDFNLRFAGQYYDSETGLHYNYFRDYDPSTGRYVQSDPIGLGGGLNTYGYVGGNPLYWIDPLGLESEQGGYRFPTIIPILPRLPEGEAYTWELPSPLDGMLDGFLCKKYGMCNEDGSEDAKQCDNEREKSRAKGIPDSQIGPSGKPKIHVKKHSSKKGAEDAASQDGGGPPMHHPSPTVGGPHYHPTDRDGNKIPGKPHHEY